MSEELEVHTAASRDDGELPSGLDLLDHREGKVAVVRGIELGLQRESGVQVVRGLSLFLRRGGCGEDF